MLPFHPERLKSGAFRPLITDRQFRLDYLRYATKDAQVINTHFEHLEATKLIGRDGSIAFVAIFAALLEASVVLWRDR
jgi:hypothetical protein